MAGTAGGVFRLVVVKPHRRHDFDHPERLEGGEPSGCRVQKPLGEAREALGPTLARTAEERGAAMTAAGFDGYIRKPIVPTSPAIA